MIKRIKLRIVGKAIGALSKVPKNLKDEETVMIMYDLFMQLYEDAYKEGQKNGYRSGCKLDKLIENETKGNQDKS